MARRHSQSAGGKSQCASDRNKQARGLSVERGKEHDRGGSRTILRDYLVSPPSSRNKSADGGRGTREILYTGIFFTVRP